MGTFGTPSSYNNTGALGSATNPTTAQGLSRDRENQKAVLELPGTQAWTEKTITDGVIIPTSAEIIVLPEGGASTDSLTTIVLTSDGTTTLHEGMLLRLKANSSNTITVVHGTGVNNISTIDGNNVVLDTTWYLELKLISGLWVQQETNAYKTANAALTAANLANTPATTTARGIGRVATSADLVDGATINNGPAFLAAGSDVVTPTPTPNTIMRRDEAGRVRVEDPVHDKDVANKTYVDNSLIWVMTGSITLNGTTDNTVVMTGIVTELELEVGDVIRIDTGTYAKLHTVESITNNGSIIVNYEHAGNRRNGSLKLPDFTGTATVTRIAKWFNAPLGLGQAWVNLATSRSANTNYTNTAGRAIFVGFILPLASGGAILVDGVQVGASSGSAGTSNYAIVPSGGVYRVNGSLTVTIWTELR